MLAVDAPAGVLLASHRPYPIRQSGDWQYSFVVPQYPEGEQHLPLGQTLLPFAGPQVSSSPAGGTVPPVHEPKALWHPAPQKSVEFPHHPVVSTGYC